MHDSTIYALCYLNKVAQQERPLAVSQQGKPRVVPLHNNSPARPVVQGPSGCATGRPVVQRTVRLHNGASAYKTQKKPLYSNVHSILAMAIFEPYYI